MILHRRLIAILRGLEPERAAAVGAALVEAGLTRIEVPLNSPEPFASIRTLVTTVGQHAEVGAGTVVDAQDVIAVAEAGGRFVVAPNADVAVIQAAKTWQLQSWPGVFTATEAFAAIKAGADALKIFPASVLGAGGLKALKAVLPKTMPIYAVGGVDAPDFAAWAAAGCDGFGIGTSLFVPGRPIEEIAARAQSLVAAHDAVFGNLR